MYNASLPGFHCRFALGHYGTTAQTQLEHNFRAHTHGSSKKQATSAQPPSHRHIMSTPASPTAAAARANSVGAQTGHVGCLTADQAITLDKLKEALSAQALLDTNRHDDYFLLRFLRARKFDLQKTLDMLVAHEKWRKEHNVDELVRSFHFDEGAQVNALYPRYYHKTDKLGRPIYIEVLSNVNLDQLFKLTTRERLEHNFIVEYEKLATVRFPACGKAVDRHIETGVTILDLKNCSVMQALKIKDILQFIIHTGQNHYPETMGMTVMINAPWIFDTVWNLIKGWMDEVTVAKIKIFKSGKDYSKTLFEFMDPANVPAAIGGACKCEGGCENSDAGPWNPSAK